MQYQQEGPTRDAVPEPHAVTRVGIVDKRARGEACVVGGGLQHADRQFPNII